MSEIENDDIAFINAMELAIDCQLEITEEEWKRYLELMEKRNK